MARFLISDYPLCSETPLWDLPKWGNDNSGGAGLKFPKKEVRKGTKMGEVRYL